MRNRFAFIAVALLGAISLPALSKDAHHGDAAVVGSSEPGKATVANVVKVTGTVQAIDVPTRHLTIKGPGDKVSSLELGPDVRNLEQVKVGDQVVVRYAQALTLTLMKSGAVSPSRTESAAGGRSPEGDRPAGAIGQKVEITADVVAVDSKKKTITLRGPEHEVDLKVRDPAQLKLIKAGDQVHAVYTEAVAVSVEPAAPAGK
jgi:Cu/Ag efflux protein CusF